jgi:hypothetical protein
VIRYQVLEKGYLPYQLLPQQSCLLLQGCPKVNNQDMFKNSLGFIHKDKVLLVRMLVSTLLIVFLSLASNPTILHILAHHNMLQIVLHRLAFTPASLTLILVNHKRVLPSIVSLLASMEHLFHRVIKLAHHFPVLQLVHKQLLFHIPDNRKLFLSSMHLLVSKLHSPVKLVLHSLVSNLDPLPLLLTLVSPLASMHLLVSV